MPSTPDAPESSSVAPNPDSDELIPGLPDHLVVAHVLDKFSDPTDLAWVSAVSPGMHNAVAATMKIAMKVKGSGS